jgi:hypothetical protein
MRRNSAFQENLLSRERLSRHGIPRSTARGKNPFDILKKPQIKVEAESPSEELKCSVIPHDE